MLKFLFSFACLKRWPLSVSQVLLPFMSFRGPIILFPYCYCRHWSFRRPLCFANPTLFSRKYGSTVSIQLAESGPYKTRHLWLPRLAQAIHRLTNGGNHAFGELLSLNTNNNNNTTNHRRTCTSHESEWTRIDSSATTPVLRRLRGETNSRQSRNLQQILFTVQTIELWGDDYIHLRGATIIPLGRPRLGRDRLLIYKCP